MSAELKDCPFCGAEMQPFGPAQHNHPVNHCWLRSVSVKAHEYEQWNSRAEVASVPDAGDGAVFLVSQAFPNESPSIWRFASKDAFDLTPPEKRRTLYTRPQPAPAVLTPGKINVIADELFLWEALPKEWGSLKKEGMIQGFARAVLAAAGK